MKNKKSIILIFVIFILLIGVVIYFSRKNDLLFVLNGDEYMFVKYGTSYEEPGFTAQDGFGNDLSNYVQVNGKVNPLVSGIYQINYELNYNDEKLTLNRIVAVKNVTLDDLEIVLNGVEEKYIVKDSLYQEDGAVIINKLDNNLFYGGDLSISSNLDTSKAGTYEINYQFTYAGSSISKTRKVVVLDIDYQITPSELTSNKVTISMNLGLMDGYTNILLPDGSRTYRKDIEYEVSSNGKYTFVITLANTQELTKEIEIDNIIANYTCTGEITSTGSKLIVSPVDNIRSYEWTINGVKEVGTSIYQKNKTVNTAQVNLIFNDNKSYQINCNITDKLVYHFKYDENNTKPYMSCNTYTSADKARLDALLKRAVSEAGYGTRAGAVAAARFLVGGLDYKVKYMGTKPDYRVGRYPYVGLNIGQSGAWGCNVGGYTQGMDCTSFVSWVWSQNGIKDNAYKDQSQQINVRNNINRLRPGDLLYSPCSGECKNDMGLSHVGIIIGIDDKNIYVAEATTGTIDAIVVTKWDKYNMPTHGKFSIGHIYNYSSDGNLTNMWMS